MEINYKVGKLLFTDYKRSWAENRQIELLVKLEDNIEKRAVAISTITSILVLCITFLLF